VSTDALAVVDGARAAVARHDRPDLDARLAAARDRVLGDRTRVLVVGEFKQGKSLLVNGLVGAPVCPSLDDVATAVPTVVRHAETVSTTLVRPGGERVDVPPDDLADHVCEQGNPGNREGWDHAEVGIPRAFLAGGLEIVDTPGVGGLSSVHGAATTGMLPSAHAVLLVSDAAQEYTAPELEFLRHAASVCPNVVCVVTKTDLYPQWRRIVDLDREHLAAAGIGARIVAVSSTLRWQAVLTGDADLNAESGFPELVGFLRGHVLGQAAALARRGVVHDVLTVTEQLAAPLVAERTARQDPAAAAALTQALAAAQERANALKERSARWQQTLNDGIADLNADVDHDLRDRLREISRMAEDELFAGSDPATVWDQFTAWLQQEVAGAASANFIWATQRVRALATQVAEHFSDDRDPLLPTPGDDPSDAIGAVRPLTAPVAEDKSWGAKVLTGLRGGYSNMSMFGTLGTLLGFASTLNPIGIGAAILMSGKAVGDERRRQVTRRQNEAKAAMRRYVDDVTFQVSKDSRDRLRTVHRELRDHFTAQAEQLKRDLAEAQQAAERAVKTSRAERETRLGEIAEELAALDAVRRRARALLAEAVPEPAPGSAA
jgi:hypothetical protein